MNTSQSNQEFQSIKQLGNGAMGTVELIIDK